MMADTSSRNVQLRLWSKNCDRWFLFLFMCKCTAGWTTQILTVSN